MARLRMRVVAATSIIGFGAAALLGTGIARGDLPMNVAMSGQPFTATIGSLTGTSVSIYPRNMSTRDGTVESMAIKLGTATLTDLCLSMVAHGIPAVGDATITIRAPGPSTTAENLVIDTVNVGGSIGLQGLVIGADFSPTDQRAAVQAAGMASERTTLTSAHITATALRASSLTLTNFDVTISRGDRKC